MLDNDLQQCQTKEQLLCWVSPTRMTKRSFQRKMFLSFPEDLPPMVRRLILRCRIGAEIAHRMYAEGFGLSPNKDGASFARHSQPPYIQSFGVSASHNSVLQSLPASLPALPEPLIRTSERAMRDMIINPCPPKRTEAEQIVTVASINPIPPRNAELERLLALLEWEAEALDPARQLLYDMTACVDRAYRLDSAEPNDRRMMRYLYRSCVEISPYHPLEMLNDLFVELDFMIEYLIREVKGE